MADPKYSAFGKHLKSLRVARGYGQAEFADYSGVSPDTIRRLERGGFSPSLDTLEKLCGGLKISLTTMFETFELGERDEVRELTDALYRLDPRTRLFALGVLRLLIEWTRAR